MTPDWFGTTIEVFDPTAPPSDQTPLASQQTAGRFYQTSGMSCLWTRCGAAFGRFRKGRHRFAKGKSIMAEPFIPRADAAAQLWMRAFAGGISLDPARYMIAPAQSALISEVVQRFCAAMLVSSNEATRTKPSLIVKQNARAAAERVCREYARLIKFNLGIDDADKVAIGVKPINLSRSEVTVPQTFPLLGIIGATPGRQVLCYHDSTTPDRSAKPFGAHQLLLYRAIADERVAGPEQAKFYKGFTRSRMPVDFEQEHDGKIATYFACWSGRRGETGPWSESVSMRIAA
jgi:hypothetical protein